VSKFRCQQNGDSAEVWIYAEIGEGWGWGISAKDFADEINALDVSEMTVHINSPGGDVFDGVAMHTVLKRHKAAVTVTIDGLAASAASLVAMAGDNIEIAQGAFVMVHHPWTFGMGNASEFREIADQLEKIGESLVRIYAERTDNTETRVREWLDAETWMDSDEAVSNGFADALTDQPAIAASVDKRLFAHAPDRLQVAAKISKPAPAAWRLAAAERALTFMRG